MASALLTAFLAAYATVTTHAVRTVIQNVERMVAEERPCKDDSVYCQCTTPPTKTLPLLSGAQSFNFFTISTFYISGAGFEGYKKKAWKPGYLDAMKCLEVKGPGDSQDAEPLERQGTCLCNSASLPNGNTSFGNCLNRKEGSMCVPHVEMLRCHKKDGSKIGYFRLDSAPPALFVRGAAYCTPWVPHATERRVWCEWEAADMPEDASEEKLKEKCLMAVGNKGNEWIFPKGFEVYTRHNVCGRNMKLGKCVNFMMENYREHIKGSPWAVILQ